MDFKKLIERLGKWGAEATSLAEELAKNGITVIPGPADFVEALEHRGNVPPPARRVRRGAPNKKPGPGERMQDYFQQLMAGRGPMSIDEVYGLLKRTAYDGSSPGKLRVSTGAGLCRMVASGLAVRTKDENGGNLYTWTG